MGVGEFIGKIPVVGGIGQGIYTAGTNAFDDVTGAMGEGVEDYMNNGKNRYQGAAYQVDQPYWGGYDNGAQDFANIGLRGMGGSDVSRRFAQGEAFNERGPQAWENQDLSDREAFARGWHQNGALELAQEAAMGLAPSAAEGQLNAGFNRAANATYGQAAGARGAAAIAQAQGNAANARAGLMAEQANAAGQLRSQEMSGARNLYGGLANEQRQQDLTRLNMGNQMAVQNAQMNDQYRLGMGNLGVQYGNQGAQWYQAAQNPYNQNLNAQMQGQNIMANSWDSLQNNEYGRTQANADLQRRNRDEVTETILGGVDTAAGGLHPSKSGTGMGQS